MAGPTFAGKLATSATSHHDSETCAHGIPRSFRHAVVEAGITSKVSSGDTIEVEKKPLAVEQLNPGSGLADQ